MIDNGDEAGTTARTTVGNDTPTRKLWSTPRLTLVEVDSAEGSFAGVGADSGVYS